MVPGGAGDDVVLPGGVVETTAAGGTGHPAVAGEELAALAEREAVSLVLAEELLLPALAHGDDGSRVVPPGEAALHCVQVCDVGIVAGAGQLGHPATQQSEYQYQ